MHIMSSINPIILETLKKMIAEDSTIPNEIEPLVKKLLEIESIAGNSSGGIEKLYDQVLDEYIKNGKINQWSKDYAE